MNHKRAKIVTRSDSQLLLNYFGAIFSDFPEMVFGPIVKISIYLQAVWSYIQGNRFAFSNANDMKFICSHIRTELTFPTIIIRRIWSWKGAGRQSYTRRQPRRLRTGIRRGWLIGGLKPSAPRFRWRYCRCQKINNNASNSNYDYCRRSQEFGNAAI